MPDLDLDNGADSQDGAETFDETHREDELVAGDVDFDENPDVAEDVYDVTSALGDADDEDDAHAAMDASDYGPDDLDPDDLEEDEDDDDDLVDDFEDDPEDDDIEAVDHRADVIAGLAGPSEPGLTYMANIDAATDPRDDETDKYESTRPLSDAQLAELGYLNETK